ncbi:hypothetical protein WJX72_007700 [[Myrmecia] bisecta]|uniref:Uncharacterized protein n=1 Tax=[Myrmecia] bisecta TaxID=41462 RepID=A0AAW1R7H9_9CHLO
MSKLRPTRGRRSGVRFAAGGLAVVVLLSLLLTRGYWTSWLGRTTPFADTAPARLTHRLALQEPGSEELTLVVYLYSPTEPQFNENFLYFAQRGIASGDGCDYIIVVLGEATIQDAAKLPKLPSNAQYYFPQQACSMAWGTIGQVLTSSKVDCSKYSYFIFLDSTVRGPYMPPYLMDTLHWSAFFRNKLMGKTKVVGPTISCQNPWNTRPDYVVTPFVLPAAVATDRVGMKLWREDGNIFKCHNNVYDERYFSEMGLSRTVLTSGYTIDSFMMRYRNVDWTNSSNWECNGRISPVGEFYYDGTTVSPFEVMFVVVDLVAVENEWSHAKHAQLFETWLKQQEAGTLNVNTNAWLTDPWSIKRQRVAYMQSRGPGCFDNRYYVSKNPDLKALPSLLELWDHFVMMGQFEGRSHRWSCSDDRRLFWES